MDHHYPALQSQGVHTVQLLQVMGIGEELTTVPCLSRSQRFQVTPLAFSLPPTWHWQLCDKKHCSAVWRSWMISSSRNAQKCCPSYLGEQQLMPCTFLFIPALKSTQEDNRSRQKQCRGCSETCPSHMHSVEMVQRRDTFWPSAPQHWGDKGMKGSILIFPNHQQMHYFQLLSVFPYCQGILCATTSHGISLNHLLHRIVLQIPAHGNQELTEKLTSHFKM